MCYQQICGKGLYYNVYDQVFLVIRYIECDNSNVMVIIKI